MNRPKKLRTLCGWLHTATVTALCVAFTFHPAHATDPYEAETELDEFHPALGTYDYKIDAGGNVGRASITIGRDGDLYRVTVRAQTNKFIDAVYKLRYEGDTTLDLATLTPVRTVIKSQEKKRSDTVDIQFGEAGIIQAVETKARKGKKTKTKSHTIETETYTIDPFSVALLARGLVWEVGYTEKFHVITGEDRYRVSLHCVAKETVDLGSEKREAWAIEPEIIPLKEKKKKRKSAVKSARIYISTDQARDFLGIWAQAFFGEIVVRLAGFTP